MSREEYIRAVLDEVERYDEDRAGLIITLDRPTGPDNWKEILDIALKLKREGRRVLGVDLAGDPLKADVEDFRAFFAQAKEASLGVTLHIAEVRLFFGIATWFCSYRQHNRARHLIIHQRKL
jgi:adenosine deaminase